MKKISLLLLLSIAGSIQAMENINSNDFNNQWIKRTISNFVDKQLADKEESCRIQTKLKAYEMVSKIPTITSDNVKSPQNEMKNQAQTYLSEIATLPKGSPKMVMGVIWYYHVKLQIELAKIRSLTNKELAKYLELE